MIAYDFGLRCTRTSKTEVLFALNEMIISRANLGRTTVLIVDEAHNLDWDVLEEIRLLGNLENWRGKMLQILLAGQPELGPQTGGVRFPPVETAGRSPLRATAFSTGRDFGVHTVAVDAGWTKRTDSFPARGFA